MIFRTETNSADCDVQRRGRMAGTAAIAVVLTVALAGCTTGDADAEPTSQAESGAPASAAADPSASPSPEQAESAEPDDPEAIIEQRTADAIERYKEYSSIKNEFERRGEGAYTKLEKGGYLGSHAIREYEQEWGDGLAERGIRQTGHVEIEDMRFIEYKGDPTQEFLGHEILLDACLDLSGIDLVDASGKSQVNNRQNSPKMDVVMRGVRLNVNGETKIVWAVASDSISEKEC